MTDASTLAEGSRVSRTYGCDNSRCPNHGIEQVVHPRRVGVFWEFPALTCMCGFGVRVVAINGTPLAENHDRCLNARDIVSALISD